MNAPADAPGRRLVILRHAKSDWSEGVPDHQRPLNDRGRRDAPEAGRWIRAHVDRLDAVACSTAERARQTWALAARELADPPTAVFDDEIYGAPPDALMAVIGDLPDDAATALIVGHNPGVQHLVAVLSGEEVEMKTASVAVVSWTGRWSDVAEGIAVLEQSATPRA